MLPPKHRCPWFYTGFVLGLAFGVWCIHTGIEQARTIPSAPTSSL